jgi:galactoside O-acetyltransferase
MLDSRFYTEEDLRDQGFGSIGKNVMIDENCIIVGKENVSIGSNVRIDAYTIITANGSGFVNIGSNIHISSNCLLAGSHGITLEDFTNISSGSKLFSASDNYVGEGLIGPMVPDKYRKIYGGHILMKKFSIVGAGSIVLPNLTIGEGTSVGALSKVVRSLDDWWVYDGSPVEKVKPRSKRLIELERQYLEEYSG